MDIVEKEEVWFEYSVEFIGEPDDSLIPPLEIALLSFVEEELLQCVFRRRRLAGYEGSEIIGAIDYFPVDEKLDEDCPGGEDNCSVYKGRMDIYLTETEGAEDAILATRKSIRDTFNNGDLPNGKIEKISYLGPDLGTSSAIDTDGGSLQSNPALQNSLSAPMVTMISLGVVCVIIAFAAGYRYKNNYYEKDDGPSTLGPTGSEITATNSNLSAGSNSTPGFSAMMPSAYRLGESHCMDAILEGDISDSSRANTTSSDIMVSESGFTEEGDSRDASMLQYSGEHVLGAERLDGFDPNSNSYLYEDSNSEIPPPSLLGSSNETWEDDAGEEGKFRVPTFSSLGNGNWESRDDDDEVPFDAVSSPLKQKPYPDALPSAITETSPLKTHMVD